MTQKKPAIQRILNTPVGQIPCIAGFLDTNNKRIDRSIVSMLRSMFGGDEEDRTLDLTDANRTLSRIVLNTGPFDSFLTINFLGLTCIFVLIGAFVCVSSYLTSHPYDEKLIAEVSPLRKIRFGGAKQMGLMMNIMSPIQSVVQFLPFKHLQYYCSKIATIDYEQNTHFL